MEKEKNSCVNYDQKKKEKALNPGSFLTYQIAANRLVENVDLSVV